MATEQDTSYQMLESSLLPDCLSLSPSPSAKMEQSARKKHTLCKPDWSLLPEELLHYISTKHLEDHCFDVVHARSVCSSWRSSFPFPSCLLRPRYSLPSLPKFGWKRKELCILEKTPMFLFKVLDTTAASALPSEYFMGDLSRDNRLELPSHLQCSVKVNVSGSNPFLMNMLDCQILPLGYQYRMVGRNPEEMTIAFLPLNKDEGGEAGEEFVVLLSYSSYLLMLTSAEMRWMWLSNIPNASCSELVTFRGRFYLAFLNGDICVFDPCSLEATDLMPSQPLRSSNYLISSGNDELFLVEIIGPYPLGLAFGRFTCRVSRLDEEASKWVEVRDLGNRALFIGLLGNSSCSAKELPDGCGVSKNSIVFTFGPCNVSYIYKYGVHTGNTEDDLNWWRCASESRVNIFYTKS
ncbi:hypothetical protein CARUB_v10023331mg [Capsella rubella]|uniref:KIB1-4 beta-propeller domain-containing protein n=1 Tax=Capsella rubella TaxID=81985 RepID=R0FX01_9BRAS|nr:F-box/kelch-repeat protein At1g64840 [Capsella rubella]EOA27221.1 hypothetical protein CARUB_v10023331mg [Capsella rubella]